MTGLKDLKGSYLAPGDYSKGSYLARGEFESKRFGLDHVKKKTKQ